MTLHFLAFEIPRDLLTELSTSKDWCYPRGTVTGLENQGRIFYIVEPKTSEALLEAYKTFIDADRIKPGLNASPPKTDRGSAEKAYVGAVIPKGPEGTD